MNGLTSNGLLYLAEGAKITPAGLIIIISELSNIGQTLLCIPDYLDQTIL